MIYFIRPKAGGRIKIGTTIRLSERLKQLAWESGEELDVLAVADGSHSEERNLHRRFAHLRIVGEWFEAGEDLLGFIVTECMPWDGSDEVPARPNTVVKIDAEIVDQAKLVVLLRHTTLTDFLSEMLRGPVAREYGKEKRKLAGGESSE
jgi:hypothetical protein